MSDPFSILHKEIPAVVPKFDATKKVNRYRKGEGVEVASDEFLQKHIVKDTEAIQICEISLPKNLEEAVEYEESSEESEEERVVMYKPVFVRRDQRVTDAEKTARAEEETQEAIELARLEGIRRDESRRLCEAALKTEETEHLEGMDEVDDLDDPEDYAAWKVRELKRIVRDREERVGREIERQEIERRRNLTDWEREEENKCLGTDETSKPLKQKQVYMQKYYHSGSFFQDRDAEGKLDPIFMRDYNAPVEGDYDRSNLPATMQKRRGEWGMKGQVKHTHLTAEDTTDFDPLHKALEQVVLKQQLKGAGYKGMNSFDSHFNRPS
jgi:microfibrillar-associated protein 1